MAGKKGRMKKIIMAVMGLIVLGILCFFIALCAIYYMETHPGENTGNTDAIIVLGAQVYANGDLSPQLELRMEAARKSYLENPRLIICCGAQGANEPAPEGEGMRNWLLDQGIPAEMVLAENKSRNTHQNLQNAVEMLPETAEKITIITSDYHLPRAMAIARDMGLDAEGIGSPCKPEYWVKNHFREVLAWGKYFLKKVVPIE